MAIYYIEDANGTILSEDGTRRFRKLSGKEAYDFLQTAEGRKKRFMKTGAHEDGGEEEYVEVPTACMREHRRDERHRQYVSDSRNGSGITVISVNDLISPDGEITGEDVIEDESVDIEKTVIHAGEIETLRKALETLTDTELAVIKALYLSDNRLSERETAKRLGISQVAVHKRKLTVLRKLKNFFES